MPRRLLVLLILLVGVFGSTIGSAWAHNVLSDVDPVFPWYNGDMVRLEGVHKILSCQNNGDGHTCAEGFGFKAEVSFQVKIGGSWGNANVTQMGLVRHYPDYTATKAVMILYCQPTDGDVTLRTRARGWVNHGGVWSASPWGYSLPRTVRCAN